jgi:hypothetical protein
MPVTAFLIVVSKAKVPLSTTRVSLQKTSWS